MDAGWRNAIAAVGSLAALSIVGSTALARQQTPSAKDLSVLIEMLGSPDPVVRVSVACARNVFDASMTAAIPALVELLDDAEQVSPDVCREDRRGWWGKEDSITAGQEAARALVRIGVASFDSLVQALASPGPVARRNAAWALGALDDPRAVAPLIGSLRDSDDAVREQAAWALGALDDPRAVQRLVGALRDASVAVRRQAAWALGAIDDRAAVGALVDALKDTDARVRQQSAWALGAIGDERATAGLSLALKDTQASVRKQAAWALGAIAD
jgi:HEAT repeat protein